MAAEFSCNQNGDCKEASKSELTEELGEVLNNDNADTKETEEVQPAEHDCEICDFVSNKESGVRIHMLKKHVTCNPQTCTFYFPANMLLCLDNNNVIMHNVSVRPFQLIQMVIVFHT